MFKKLIITTALLFCSSTVWASQIANEISNEYISKVTSHLDGLKNQSSVIEEAKKEVEEAKTAVRSAAKETESIQNQLNEEIDNKSAYPRRIKRDLETIEEKREESKRIFRNTFPEFNTPDEAIRSVNVDRNALQEEKNILNDRLDRKEREFRSSLNRAKSEAESNRLNLDKNLQELSNIDSQLPGAQENFRQARQEFRRAKDLIEDPQLKRKINQAERKLAEINEERIREGKSCGGLSPIFSSVCRRYIDAQKELAQLQALAAPGALRPYRQRLDQAERNLENLRQNRRRLATETNRLEDNYRRARSRLADLEEDLRIETNPIRGEIAVLDGQLDRLNAKLAEAKKLEKIANDIVDFQKRVKRNEEKLAELPALIEQIKRNLSSANENLKNAREASADLSENLAREQNVLINQKAEINSLRLDMNNSLATVESLAPTKVTTPNVDIEIMESRDWSVITTDLDNEWSRATCRAETLEIVEEGDSEVITSANLKVVNLVNPVSGFNEPLVVVTVDSARDDLVNFSKVTVRGSSSETFTFDLIYSKSSQNKLFFMSDLNDREGLIDIILKKSRMEVVLSNLSPENSEEITFSLRGSTNALNSRSSRDNSLRNACGGIDILEL